jgi:hypothetical protein
MIETLYIHTGAHKTGTSSIQKFFHQNIGLLHSRDGLEYPGFKRPMLKTTPTLEDYRVIPEAFDDLQSINARKAVISRENFSWVDNKESLIEFKKNLGKSAQNIKLIFYIRRQDLQAISQKQEGTKWPDCSAAYGHDLSALPLKLKPVARRYLNYDKRIGMWADVFGDENTLIRVFEKKKFHKNDLICDFCNIIGIEPDDYTMPEVTNESFARESQLFLHQTRHAFKEGSSEKKFLVNAIRAYDNKIIDRRKLLPSKEEAQVFYDQFRASNESLNRRFAITEEDCIFDEDFSMFNDEADHDGLDLKSINKIYSFVIKRMLQNRPVK